MDTWAESISSNSQSNRCVVFRMLFLVYVCLSQGVRIGIGSDQLSSIIVSVLVEVQMHIVTHIIYYMYAFVC